MLKAVLLLALAGSLAAQTTPQTAQPIVSVSCTVPMTYADGARFTFTVAANGTSYCSDIPASLLASLQSFAQNGPTPGRDPRTGAQLATAKFAGDVSKALSYTLRRVGQEWVTVQATAAAQAAASSATAAAQATLGATPQ